MTSISTPDSVIDNLIAIREEAEKGVAALYAAEVKLAELESEADKIEALALIQASGSVAHKEAVATLKSADARLAAEIAKAEYQRIKTKLRHLELAQSSIQTQAKMIEVMFKTAGMGER
jgi:hypothetical protein